MKTTMAHRLQRSVQYINFRTILPLLGLVMFVANTPAFGQNDDSTAKDSEAPAAADVPVDPFPDAVVIPPGILDGGTEWLNTSHPLDLKELRGKVVLLDFWTYCCINCIHVLPDLKFLEKKYEKELVVIGVHSAKFDNEKLSENIRDAILRYEIKHPVVNDSEMLIWRRFGTRSWPTLALIDPEGRFIGRQGGEGNRDLFDGIIGKIAAYHRAKGTLDETPIVFDLEENRATPTPLRYPGKILADAASNRLFISDSNHNRIVITDLNGTLIDTIGTGQIGREDGAYTDATFDHPQGMALIGDTLYVADTENHMIRTVDLMQKAVSTLCGTGEQGIPRRLDGRLSVSKLNSPWDLCHIDGLLFIAMAGPHQIWSHKLGSETIEVHAGNAAEDIINGSLDRSSFAQPSGLTLDGDGKSFYVADSEGSSIRKVSVSYDGDVTTVAGTSELPRGQSLFAFGDVDAIGEDARFQHPLGVAWHNGQIYVADSYNHKIKKVDAASGKVTTWLGTGDAGSGLDPVELSEPAGLSIAGNDLFIADTNNHRICKVDLTTKRFSVIELNGVKAPARPKTRRLPDLNAAVAVPDQVVKSGDSVRVSVRLNVPENFKLNELAPVTRTFFQIDGDQLFPSDELSERRQSEVKDGMATFEIPLTEAMGKATTAVELSYGYCSSDGGICRLASQTWKFSLTVAEDAEQSEIVLEFSHDAKGE